MSAVQGRKIAGPLAKLLMFAAVTVVLTGLLAQTLGSFGFGGGTTYRARFSDVTGLMAGDDVRIAGVKVGRVEGVRLAGAAAEVSFSVDQTIPLTASVHATIRWRNLVGQRYLALTDGQGGASRLGAGALIPLSRTTPALDLTVVFNGFRPLFAGLSPTEINRFAYQIVQVLQGEGGTMASLLQHTASLANTLADRDAAIGRLITNLNAVLGTLDQHSAAFNETIVRLQELVSGLAADRKAIGAAVTSIGQLASTTGDLIQDARPDLAQDVSLLDKLAGTMNANSQTIESTLARLPDRYAALTRTATYGSWLNFYLCDFDGQVGLGTGKNVASPSFSSGAARCDAPGIVAGGTP